MTITDLEEFIRGIPLERSEKEAILASLAEVVTLEETDPSVLDQIAAIAQHIGPALEKAREETNQELEHAKNDLAATLENSRRKLQEFDEKAIAHLRELADQAIAEIDRIEEAAAKSTEHDRRSKEAKTISSLVDKIRNAPKA